MVFLVSPRPLGEEWRTPSQRLPRQECPQDMVTVPSTHRGAMYSGGPGPAMLYRDMQLQGLGYTPNVGKRSVAGDKKVAPGRAVCVLNCRLAAHPQGRLTKPPLLGAGFQPIAGQIGAAVLTRQEKHTPSLSRCRYPILIRWREGS